MSAIGADLNSSSEYGRTKARAEKAVLDRLGDQAVILRPSIVFGPEDGFFNKFADMARYSPALPLIGGGTMKFQPVYVGDVAEAFARAVDGKIEGGKIYELGGPEVLTFRECLEEILEITERKRLLLNTPLVAGPHPGPHSRPAAEAPADDRSARNAEDGQRRFRRRRQ
jgi:uncharacterized protein YbjT (DUF2867 family)